MLKNKINWWMVALIAVWIMGGASVLYAQDETLTLTMDSEQDIGGECPIATAVQAESDLLWVLMSQYCGSYLSGLTTLQAFDLNTLEPRQRVQLSPDSLGEDLGDGLTPDDLSVYSLMTPFTVTANGELIVYASGDNLFSIVIDPQTGEMTPRPDADERLNSFLSQFTSYPGYAVTFSPDHTHALVFDDEGQAMYIVDLAAETVLLELDAAQATFSADNTRLYASAFVDPDDTSSDASIVSVYSLPDGDLLTSFEMPIPLVYPSPDGRYAALVIDRFEGGMYIIGYAELSAIDLDTGNTSPRQLIGTGPRPVLTCVNDGRNIADLNYTTDGDLPLVGLHWLPDSARFITVNSHGGQISNSGCVFEYSRLREYSISGG